MPDPAASTGAKSGDAKDGSSSTYGSRVLDVSRWAVGGLAAVGTAAVTKLSLDRLGKGDLNRPLIIWAFVGLVLFALGVAAAVAAIVWLTQDARVTIGYLLGKGSVPTEIAKFFAENSYFLGSQATLGAFRDRLNALEHTARPLSASDKAERLRLLAQRDTILKTGSSERIRIISKKALALIVSGALSATVGAATFALATNRDLVLRDDRLAQEARDRQDVISGELLPQTPSPILLDVPAKYASELQDALGKDCETTGAKAILVEIGRPPTDAIPASGDDTYVSHVITERSEVCSVVDLWVPPGWVVPRSAGNPPVPTPSPAATSTAETSLGASEPSVGPE